MKNIIKYLRPYWNQVLLILILLVVQAYCDLSLPQYTSDIVDNGIQQGGIENAAIHGMSETSFDEVKLFLNEDERKLVDDNYKLVKSANASEKQKDFYPVVYTKNIYVLNTKDADVIDNLSEILSKPFVVMSSLSERNMKDMTQQSMGDSGVNPMENLDDATRQDVMMKLLTGDENATAANTMVTAELAAEMGKMQKMTPEEQEAFMQEKLEILVTNAKGAPTVLNELELLYEQGMMTQTQLANLADTMVKKLGDVSESIIDQMSINYVKTEYKALGVDMDKLQTNYLLNKGLLMTGMTFLMMLVSIFVGLFASKVAAGVGMNVRSRIFKNVVEFSNAEIDKFSTASLITRSTNDVQQVQMVIVMMLRMVAYAPILGIGGIIKVVSTRTSMGWIVVVAVAALLCLIGTLMAIAMPKFKEVQKLVDRLNLVSREILSGLPVIRAFSRDKYEEERFAVANKNLKNNMVFTNRVMTVMMPVMMLIMNGVSVAIVWFGAHGIDKGNLQVGDMMAFITYTMQIIMSFLMLAMISVFLPRAIVSANRIEEVLKTKSSIKDKKESKKLTDVKGRVCFDNVTFSYPDADEPVLTNISFEARPGETTAIIGSTGSGKSTLINLIPRFYDVSEGKVSVDGIDVRDISQHDLRQEIGYVPQKGMLFSGTIESNLKFGCEDASMDVVEKAADIAQATEFIETKKHRYESHIAQGGDNVSGGQKQRLSIARAIAKNPKIFIFDDSFSALDFKTDVALRKALNDNVSDSTVIIVAQRISTILHAEQILVLEDGEMVGKGTHEELLESCEVYRQIAQSQLSEEELNRKGSAENE